MCVICHKVVKSLFSIKKVDDGKQAKEATELWFTDKKTHDTEWENKKKFS